MKALIRQLFVALLGGVVAAGVMLVANHIGIGRGPSIALAQTSASVATPASLDADAAKTINYQGQVFNPNTGAPLANAALPFNFRITNDSGGVLYQESKSITTNGSGFFSTRIGDTASFGDTDAVFNIFSGQALFLVVLINGEQLSPPQPITFVPYALWSLQAHHLDNHGVDDFPKIVAYGVVDSNGNKVTGKAFSVSRQASGGSNTYFITLANNLSFDINDYTAIVSPACKGVAAIADIGASERGNTGINDMIVDIFDASGNHQKCTFQFMVLAR
jgi:hypothetical protein